MWGFLAMWGFLSEIPLFGDSCFGETYPVAVKQAPNDSQHEDWEQRFVAGHSSKKLIDFSSS